MSVIPKDWKRVAIEDIACHVTSGSRGWSRYEADSGPRFFGVGDLPKDGTSISPKAIRHVTPPQNSGEITRTQVSEGDILISITADLGRIGYVQRQLDGSGFVNQHLALVRLRPDEVNAAFVAYVLSGHDQRIRLLRLNDSSAKSGLNLETIKRFDFPLPPRDEQRRIVNVLDVWDDAINQTALLLAAKRRRFNEARVRLIEAHQVAGGSENGWRTVGFGDITEELKKRNTAGFAADRVMGVLKSDGLVPMRSHVMASDLRRYLVVPTDAFAYNPMRLNIGSIAKSSHGRDILVSPDYVVFQARNGAASPEFLRFFIGTKRWRNHLVVVGSGSVRTRVYFDGLSQMVLRAPGVVEQERIGAVLKQLEEDASLTAATLVGLRRQKRGLMQKLLTGELRLDERFEPAGGASIFADRTTAQ